MGIADRDYMYDRVRAGAGPSRFKQSNSRSSQRLAVASSVGVALITISVPLINQYGIPSFAGPSGPILSFPASGDVFITESADLRRGQSRFRITVPAADRRNYVVLLTAADTGQRIMAIYCRSGDDVVVPVPIGRYRVLAASGLDWYGLHDLFGRSTHVEEVVPEMVATVMNGTGIEFRRRPDGNLRTQTMLKSHFFG